MTLSLEERVALIEDKLAILNLIASHPLTADTGDARLFPHMYTEDAVFDRGPELHGAAGLDKLIAFAESAAHKTAMEGGLAHFGNLPCFIEVSGDSAEVVSYIMIVTARGEDSQLELANHGTSRGHDVFRVVANRWTVVRTASGWRIKARKLFPLDGSAAARDLLKGSVTSFLGANA